MSKHVSAQMAKHIGHSFLCPFKPTILNKDEVLEHTVIFKPSALKAYVDHAGDDELYDLLHLLERSSSFRTRLGPATIRGGGGLLP